MELTCIAFRSLLRLQTIHTRGALVVIRIGGEDLFCSPVCTRLAGPGSKDLTSSV